MVQWVKDLVLLQLWCKLQVQCGFHPWPGNLHHMLWVRQKKKKDKWYLVIEPSSLRRYLLLLCGSTLTFETRTLTLPQIFTYIYSLNVSSNPKKVLTLISFYR